MPARGFGPIIDAHVHPSMPGRDELDDIIRVADQAGVERLCVFSLGPQWSQRPTLEECDAANAEVRDDMRRYPGRVVGFVYVNPEYGQAALDRARRAVESEGFSAIKLWIATKCTSPAIEPVVELAIARGCPILQHAWRKTTGELPHESVPAEVAALARRYPAARFIMAHSGGEWINGVLNVADCPNILVDTSGTIIDAGMIEFALEHLGNRRVVFGSDVPGNDFWINLGKVMDARMTALARRRILHDNMDDLLAGRWQP